MERHKTNHLSLKTSKKYLQPPTLAASGLLSSEDKTEYRAEQMHELSNVQQKSYASSEEHALEERELREVLAGISSRRMESHEEPQSPRSPSLRHQSSLTPRLEDQEIIAVEEEEELDSNKGKESVILEHIDFNNDSEEIEAMKVGSQQSGKGKGTGSGAVPNYVINRVEAPYSPGIVSESTPNDFSELDLRFNRVRHSKNTCGEKMQSLGVQTQKVANRSCITKQMAESEFDSFNSPHEPEDINNILKKWNNAVHPKIETRNSTPNILRKMNDRTRYLDEEVEDNVKHCISRYNSVGHNLAGNTLDHAGERITQEIDEGLLLKYQEVTAQLEKNQEDRLLIEEENKRLVSELDRKSLEVKQLSEEVREKTVAIDNWKEKVSRAEETGQKWMEEARKLQAKLSEFERVMISQSEELKYFEEKNTKLEKELTKTIGYNDMAMKGSSTSIGKSTKLRKFDTFGQLSPNVADHRQCIEQIQILEQRVFDLEQKTIGIDIEVDKRVKIMSDHLEMDLRRNIQEEYQNSVTSLQDQIARLKNANRATEEENQAILRQLDFKQRDLAQREEKVRKMYDELVVEWRSIDKGRRSRVQDNTNSNFLCPPASPSPYFLNKSPSGLDYSYDRPSQSRRKSPFSFNSSRQQPTHFSSKDISISPSLRQEKLPFRNYENRLTVDSSNLRVSSPERSEVRLTVGSDCGQGVGWSTYHSFGKAERPRKGEVRCGGHEEENELFSINSKIQKLREEINRELDLIH